MEHNLHKLVDRTKNDLFYIYKWLSDHGINTAMFNEFSTLLQTANHSKQSGASNVLWENSMNECIIMLMQNNDANSILTALLHENDQGRFLYKN